MERHQSLSSPRLLVSVIAVVALMVAGLAGIVPAARAFTSGVTQPDASNTGPGTDGLPDPSTFTVITGDFHPQSNTVTENVRVTGRIIIDAGVTDATVRNCVVEGRTLTSGNGSLVQAGAGHNTLIQFCEIFSAPYWGAANGVGTKNFTVERSDIHHVVDGVRINRTPTGNTNDASFAVVRDSWIHDLLVITPDPMNTREDKKTHADGIQIEGDDRATVYGNSIQAFHSALDEGSNVARTTCSYPFTPVTSGGCDYPVSTSAIMFSPNTPPISAVTVDHNWFGGGEVTINHQNKGTGWITDNVFSKTSMQSVAIYPETSTTFTLSGNTWPDGSSLTAKPPTFTSSAGTAFTEGSAGTFTITTAAGSPATTTLTATGALPDGVSFTDNGDGTGTLAGTPAAGTAGSYPLTITASNGATKDPTQAFTLSVRPANQPPVITSANSATFTTGSAGTFTVTTTPGFPAATTVTKSGTLPSGVSFTDNGDGTATLAGTPAAGTAGSYPLTISASNGASPDATQLFTLTVAAGTASPVITSTNRATFTTGSAGTFTVTTTPGNPAATTITTLSLLPPGVAFTDNGDGTATLAGTPAAGTAGSYPLTISASNGASPDATQSFTLTVAAGTSSPVITSTNRATFTVGTAGTFTVTTTPGTPAATTVTRTGTLPSGVTFTDNGNGTATLAGTPAAGSAASYPLTISASNGASPDATQSFTLTVAAGTSSPVITSTNRATFTVGTAGTFTVTTTPGNPATTTVTRTGTLPSGVTFTDNGNGTATLAGTPAAGSAASYPLTISASNGVSPDATQSFTLTVVAASSAPVITSAGSATFKRGTAGTFTVTTTPGVPATTTITRTGTLPSGVTFTDKRNGTATIAGTPTVAGVFPITIKASNGTGTAQQSFTLTVTKPPVITSASSATFTSGTAGKFTVTTTPGVPATTVLTFTGTLPAGVTFTDNRNGTATITGTARVTTTTTYSIVIKAANGALPDPTQRFTLTVRR